MTKRIALKKHEEKTFSAEAIAKESQAHPEKFAVDVRPLTIDPTGLYPNQQTLMNAENIKEQLAYDIGRNMALDCFSNKELKEELARRFTLALTPSIEWYCLKEIRGGSVQYRLSGHVANTPRIWLIPAHIAERQDLLFINLVSYQKELLTVATKDQINAL